MLAVPYTYTYTHGPYNEGKELLHLHEKRIIVDSSASVIQYILAFVIIGRSHQQKSLWNSQDQRL